ncbi:unnamed protein product [Hydatigera taeniaeformis]|uniref:Alpha-and gamma-adaptin-binding protein p34 n=1 Tax=Hydatigena taeniaeformis TaxID=6205 RepID=A0A0R3WU69_HYDTA|nr:unnamed protein product [Hydatigera taeniaeformis]
MLPQVHILNAHADDIANLVYDELTKTSSVRDCMNIDCKYYTASVQLKLIPYSYSKTDVKGTEALMICFDSGNPESWSVACDWLKLGEEEDIAVHLLICDSLSSENFRTEVFKEATKYHFEIVQLSPHCDEIEEDEEYGVARITAALVAHQWPNLVLKSSQRDICECVPAGHSQRKPKVATPEKKANQKDAFNGDEDETKIDSEMFNELFPKLVEMRTRCTSMDLEGRRKMAERVRVLKLRI